MSHDEARRTAERDEHLAAVDLLWRVLGEYSAEELGGLPVHLAIRAEALNSGIKIRRSRATGAAIARALEMVLGPPKAADVVPPRPRHATAARQPKELQPRLDRKRPPVNEELVEQLRPLARTLLILARRRLAREERKRLGLEPSDG